jgi:solute:Na+ symporter, SSS family
MLGFSWTLDAPIVGVYLLVTMAAGLYVRRYVGGVDDFLLAGREMNVYLGIASLAATEFGIITCMYAAELGYNFGFSGAILGILSAVSMLGLGLTGFCIRPLRDAGVRTLPELFERRFGPRIRWAAGVVIVLGGLLNMGVFLRVAGEFLVLACGLDPVQLKLTMTVLLVLVAVYTLLGGMLSVLVTDFLQFVVMSVGLLAVSWLVLDHVGWEGLARTARAHHGDGAFNPFQHPKMGWQYVVFQALVQFSAVLVWQTTIARVLAAKDSRTGRQVYTRTSFFFVCRFLIPAVWGIAALAIVTEADFAAIVQAGFEKGRESLFAMPIALGKIVPEGMLGLLIAAMLAADMSTDSSYMLTWGSVIYNDILAPFRRGPKSERSGLLWNRLIVAAIGVYLLVFGLWFTPGGNLWDYLAVTGTIYMSSMSTLFIACCYWPRANRGGAAAAIVVGAAMPITHLVCKNLGSARIREFAETYSSEWGIATYVACAAAMVVGSLAMHPDRSAEST